MISEVRRTWRRAQFIHAFPATACFDSPLSVTGAVLACTAGTAGFGFAAFVATFCEPGAFLVLFGLIVSASSPGETV